MPFGQAGFTGSLSGGGDAGGFLSSLPAIIAAVTGGRGFLGGGDLGDVGRFAGAGPLIARGGAAVARQLPGVLGGLLGGEVLEGIFGGGSDVGKLFKQSAVRIVPVPEISMIGPDGKCHTWLHATPKGWKINRSNVSGRRRHHHHPR